MDFLDLPSLEQQSVQEDMDDYQVEASRKESPLSCPQCSGHCLVGYGRKRQLFMDTPVGGKRVGIWVDRRRFRCKTCDRTFMEPLPDMDDHRQATSRLIRFIERQSLTRTFASLAGETGLDEKSVRNIFRDYVNRLEKEVRFETPRWMGIDDIPIIRKPRCVISNIEHQTLVAALPNRNKPSVVKYLLNLPALDTVQHVVMNMWLPYKDAVTSVLPGVQIVIDKFYVLRMADEAMESARKTIRAGLTEKQRRGLMRDRFVLLKRRNELNMEEYLTFSTWTKNFPELACAYELKETFFDIWRNCEKNRAINDFCAWANSIPAGIKSHFQPLLTAVDNWFDEIFAYFDHPVTNAYAENLNNLIRVMNRIGRGYSFEALRAKILFTEGAHKSEGPKSRRTREPAALCEDRTICRDLGVRDFGPQVSEGSANYGSEISTLVEKIKTGEI